MLALFDGDARIGDRADVLERMLELTPGREGAERALALAELRASLGDDAGRTRALELGFRADPTSEAVRERLAETYTAASRWADMAWMLELEGKTLPGAAGLDRLREAAALYLDRLERPADAARAGGLDF